MELPEPEDQYDKSAFRSPEFKALLNSSIHLQHRLTALSISAAHNVDAHPMFLGDTFRSDELEETETRETVISVVLGAFPSIDSDTVPWEHVLEFRDDPSSRYKFYELRNWMNELSRAKYSHNEACEKLEFLLHQYEKHLALHSLKARYTRLETLVVSGLEPFEELIRLRPSKAASTLFRIKREKIQLMEEELSLPGHEVAYIFDARNVFNPPH